MGVGTDDRDSYRLGLLGNLTSAELRVKNFAGNNSLRDQRCALQWVKMHISGFGGDPEKVTAIGVSAGAGMCLSLQIRSSLL